MSRLRTFISALVILVVFAAMASARAAELVMFEAANCEWCEVWDDEVGVVYAKTMEAALAPLRRVDIFDPRPADLERVERVRYTPTFVLMQNGAEIGRITGYPGESFFWEMLSGLLKKIAPEGQRACAAPDGAPSNTDIEGGRKC